MITLYLKIIVILSLGKYMFKFIAVLGVLFILTGCNEDDKLKTSAEKTISGLLKDPESAMFGEFTLDNIDGLSAACFTVNAKNSLGGYVGDQIFSLVKFDDDSWIITGSKGNSHGDCVSMNKELTENFLLTMSEQKASPEEIKRILLRYEQMRR